MPFSRAGQMRILHESYSFYWEILDHQKEFLVLLLVLIVAQGAFISYLKDFLRRWVVWLPAIVALAIYATVRVEPRYVSAFLVLLWTSLFSSVRLPGREAIQRFALCAVAATVLTTMIGIVHASITDFHAILRHAPSEQAQVAAGLRTMGIAEGQSLATIGIPRDSFYWARLARVRVITEIPTPYVNEYWFASPEKQEQVRSVFAKAGAVAIVTDGMPAEVTYPQSGVAFAVPGWQHIGDTSYYLYPLRNGAFAPSATGISGDTTVSPGK